GIAGGAWGGGLIVAHMGLIHTAWIGGLVVLAALALTAWSGRLDRLGPVYAESTTRIVAGH
ncbi:MFS sugar transporter, partial [Pseudomonas sp. GW247-3R2A]